MIRIGLLGEDPNDTSSIKNLFLKKYKDKVLFFPLAKGIKGYQLENPKIHKVLPIEFKNKNCKFVIFIRDLDGLKSEPNKIKVREKWFSDLNESNNNQGILLLNIWELEALIFADIETFNKMYNIKHKFSGDPSFQKEPKEELKRITQKTRKKYKESHCPEIFDNLRFDILQKKCSYFNNFIIEFEKLLLP